MPLAAMAPLRRVRVVGWLTGRTTSGDRVGSSYAFLGWMAPVCGTTHLQGGRGSGVREEHLVLAVHEPALAGRALPGDGLAEGRRNQGGVARDAGRVAVGQGQRVRLVAAVAVL